MKTEEKIKKDLESQLSSYRYQHSLNTAIVAKKLAEHYHANIEEAYLCALAHDLAKEFSRDENQKWIEHFNLSDDYLKEENKKIIHGVIGAYIAEERYNFTQEMKDAIYYHVTGRKNMTLLDKIVYLADKIEPGKDYPGIDRERELAYQDIDKVVLECLKNRTRKLEKENKKIHPLSYQAISYFALSE